MNNAKRNDAHRGGGARTAGIFIAGVVVGLIIGWGWFSLGRDNDAMVATTTAGQQTTSSSSENATMPDTGTVGGAAASGAAQAGTQTGGTMPASGVAGGISISSQAAGISVAVTSISVSVPTWVVIFENNAGKPGNALGAQMFFPGETMGSVSLLRDTIAGQSYFAGEYVDNGDHQFSKQTDTQVTTVAGTPMLVAFTAR